MKNSQLSGFAIFASLPHKYLLDPISCLRMVSYVSYDFSESSAYQQLPGPISFSFSSSSIRFFMNANTNEASKGNQTIACNLLENLQKMRKIGT